jgi:hypothetical protein
MMEMGKREVLLYDGEARRKGIYFVRREQK